MIKSTDHLRAVERYYRTSESRIGYKVLLGGTKHFGFYGPTDPPWRMRAALRRMEDELGRALDLEPGRKVLDAGCGMGRVAVHLAEAPFDLDVTGIDLLDWNVAAAGRHAKARRVHGRTRFVKMDFAELDFDDDTFDGAYTMETLVHSDRVEQVLSELFRALRPGGRLVHFEYSREPAATTPPAAARVLRIVNDTAAMPAFDRFEHGVLEGLLAGAGFVDVQVRDLTARMLPMLWVFSLIGQPTYALARLLDRPHRVINAMSGVEFYRHQEVWRYNVYSCRKPLN